MAYLMRPHTAPTCSQMVGYHVASAEATPRH